MLPGPGRRTGGFPPRSRLLSGKDFERVYALRRRVSDSYFSVNFAPGEAGLPRLGLSVGAKMVGNSVARNRVKRTVRESFRLHGDLTSSPPAPGRSRCGRARHGPYRA